MATGSKFILITISDIGEEVDHEEVDGLYQDATTPIEAVMAQTGVTGETDDSKPLSSQPEGNGTSKGNEFFILSGPDGKKTSLTKGIY